MLAGQCAAHRLHVQPARFHAPTRCSMRHCFSAQASQTYTVAALILPPACYAVPLAAGDLTADVTAGLSSRSVFGMDTSGKQACWGSPGLRGQACVDAGRMPTALHSCWTLRATSLEAASLPRSPWRGAMPCRSRSGSCRHAPALLLPTHVMCCSGQTDGRPRLLCQPAAQAAAAALWQLGTASPSGLLQPAVPSHGAQIDRGCCMAEAGSAA